MAQSIRNIIKQINDALEGVFKGGKFYGVAILVEREGKTQPQVNEQPVTFDDAYGMQTYHRLGNIGITYDGGYGDNVDTNNGYQVAMVIFNNEKITGLKTDEIAMIIQSRLASLNISSAAVTANAVILNSQQVFATEYRGSVYSLNEYQSLMQINYTVEVTYKSNCFAVCPEDFSNCAAST